MANIRESFVATAVGYIGYGCKTFNDYFGNPPGTAWCAEFVSKCAYDVGAIGKCVVKTDGAGSIARLGVASGFGVFLEGDCTVPIPGDIISFCWNGKGSYTAEGHDKYFSDHVGIVEYVSNGYVHTIEGNANGTNLYSTVCRKAYKLYDGKINGYFRPDWSLADKNYNNDGDDEMNFKMGDKNNGVLAYKSLIRCANELGIVKSKVDSTNSFGQGTYNATVEIQRKYKLEVDAIAGVKTITALAGALLAELVSLKKSKTERNAVLSEVTEAVNKLKI
ncbi:MAG: CHAP domain-containing protein [Acutalibacteraceae bacterium]